MPGRWRRMFSSKLSGWMSLQKGACWRVASRISFPDPLGMTSVGGSFALNAWTVFSEEPAPQHIAPDVQRQQDVRHKFAVKRSIKTLDIADVQPATVWCLWWTRFWPFCPNSVARMFRAVIGTYWVFYIVADVSTTAVCSAIQLFGKANTWETALNAIRVQVHVICYGRNYETLGRQKQNGGSKRAVFAHMPFTFWMACHH
jgi:hypothetical protein